MNPPPANRKRIFRTALTIVGTVIAVLLLRGFGFTTYSIPSGGMENTLFEGDRILVNKWSYGLRMPFMAQWGYHRWCSSRASRQDVVVFNNPAAPGQPVIERREVYISRCVGAPGDTLLIDSLYTVVSPEARFLPEREHLYAYPALREESVRALLRALSIPDDGLKGKDDSVHVRSFSRYEYYLLEQTCGEHVFMRPLQEEERGESKPLIVPRKGSVLRVYPWNVTLLCNTLVLHEGKRAEVKNDTLYVEGRPTQHCYFTKDYYWMASDTGFNLSDSRLFGFVPHDHLIGRATLVWFSKRPGTGLTEGYRPERFIRKVR